MQLMIHNFNHESASENIFSKERRPQEFITVEEGLFETSENKNPSTITRYMVMDKVFNFWISD